jgi:hypothetical protein
LRQLETFSYETSLPIYTEGMRKKTTFSYLKIALTALALCSASLAFGQFKKGPVPGPTKSLVDTGLLSPDEICKNLGKPRVKCQFSGQWIESICQCGPPANNNSTTGDQETYKRCANGTQVTPGMLRNCDNGAFDYQTCDCKQEPEADKTNGASTGQSCNSAEVNQLYSQCSADVTAAISSCDNDQDSGIQAAKSQLSDFAVSIGSQVAVNKACSGIAKYVGVLNGAVAAFVVYCTNSRDTCMRSCGAAASKVESPNPVCYPLGEADANYIAVKKKIDTQLEKCNALSVKAQQATTAVSNIANTVRGAQNCSKATETTADYCSKNPGTPGCTAAAQECADPAVAASNPICFCNQPGAASNPKCTGVARVGTNEMGTSTITSTSAASGAMPTFTAGREEWKPSTDGKGKSGAGEDPGGKKGGRALEAGSGGSGGGADPSGGAAGAGPGGPQVNNGFRGGGGGGGGSWTTGSGGGGGSGGYAGQGSGSGGANGGPDLRQFLPGGKYDPGARGVGGVTGLSGPDGITGPHDNIFRKIKNRYQAQRPTFLGQ